MARLTGLEPATPGVTGRYSNQLSYNRAASLGLRLSFLLSGPGKVKRRLCCTGQKMPFGKDFRPRPLRVDAAW